MVFLLVSLLDIRNEIDDILRIHVVVNCTPLSVLRTFSLLFRAIEVSALESCLLICGIKALDVHVLGL